MGSNEGTLECGCKVARDVYGQWSIEWCPLHGASADLLEACKVGLCALREWEAQNPAMTDAETQFRTNGIDAVCAGIVKAGV